MALDLIYDRTAEDAEQWHYLTMKLDTEGWSSLTAEEQQRWLTQLKGGYNHTELNRGGNAGA